MNELTPLQEEFLNLLETTDQPQGKGALCSADGFCCLGLWTVYRGFVISSIELDVGMEVAQFDNGQISVLSAELVNELNLHNNAGQTADSETSLACLNDEGLSFKQIAREVRKVPHYFFKDIVE